MQTNIKLIDALQNMSSIAEPTIYYPQSVPAEAAAAAAQSPRESFGPVFVVLVVIAVLAAVACVVGRICARRMRRRQEKRELPPLRGSYDGRREAATESPRPRPLPPLPPLPRGFLAAKGDIEDGCYEIVFPAAKPVREKQQKADKKHGGGRGSGGGNYTMNCPEIGGKRIGAVDSATFKQAKPST